VVTGGAGFIGSALVRILVSQSDTHVTTLDKLTYAGNLESLPGVLGRANHAFEHLDITDEEAVSKAFATHRPDTVFHLAAESHVDRSIDGPRAFVETNVVGTFVMLSAALRYWRGLSADERSRFRFVHVSTDEVFGSLGPDGRFTESTPYDPSSPYSATKAASDHLARAWHRTYGLPVLVTNCSNNYGPYQFPEKLIPHILVRALEHRPLPVYGAGTNVRDWLHVEDHVRALLLVSRQGRIGETYAISGGEEWQNLDMVKYVCHVLDGEVPRADGRSYTEQIEFVPDRPGHDFRYAIDATKIRQELGWSAVFSVEDGLRQTVRWYLANEPWWRRIMSGAYRAHRAGIALGAIE
jgi:dTDP-glucose 4,6-dehydratase